MLAACFRQLNGPPPTSLGAALSLQFSSTYTSDERRRSGSYASSSFRHASSSTSGGSVSPTSPTEASSSSASLDGGRGGAGKMETYEHMQQNETMVRFLHILTCTEHAHTYLHKTIFILTHAYTNTYASAHTHTHTHSGGRG